jgi:type II secretory pathway component PulF
MFRYFRKDQVLKDLRAILLELSVLLGAGVQLVKACELVGGGTTLSGVCSCMARALSRGESMTEVFHNYIAPLDPVVAGVLSVANSTEHWRESIEHAAQYLEYRLNISSVARKNMIYPALVMTLVMCVSWFYSLYVLPQLGLSNWWLPASVTLMWVAFMYLFVCADVLYAGTDYIRACYFRSIHSLISAGLTTQSAISFTVSAFDSDELREVERCVLQGIGFSEALSEFPEVVRAMIKSTENHGGIGHSCKHISDLYNAKLEARMVWISALIGPVLLCVVGAVLGLVVVKSTALLYKLGL